MTPKPPRKPGSQVPPGRKPLVSDRRTATTHSKIPIAQATAGKLYRVRDRDWAAVWGQDLSWEAATKLKDQVVASGKTRTARVEDMAIPPPAEYLEYLAQAQAQEAAEDAAEEISWSHGDSRGDADGIMERAAVRQHQDPDERDVVQTSSDPELARAAAAAISAVRPIVTASQAASQAAPAYRDKTVTAARRPVQQPPLPPPSPLKVATELDGDLLPEDALTDADLPDLAGDIGGGPSEDDIALAQRQRDADDRSRTGSGRP